MARVLACILAAAAFGASSFGQSAAAEKKVNWLVDHWRWQNYWEGTTELGARYHPGRQLNLYLFWRTKGIPPSVGFCSAVLGLCLFYPNSMGDEHSFQERMSSPDDPASSFRVFIADSFGRKDLFGHRPIESASEYTAEPVNLALPELDPPEAIRRKIGRPQTEVDALIKSLGCLPNNEACKVHVEIPFYASNDPNVPVFRECSSCQNPKPMIIFMKFVDGNWWHGAADYNDKPDFVARYRSLIRDALMKETGN